MVRKIAQRGVFMSDLAVAPHPAENNPGVAALSRLTERIATLVPPPAAADLMQPSPAVAAGVARARVLSERAAIRAEHPRSTVVLAVESFVSACAFVPYAVVALGLRLLMARIFFLDGQGKIAGPRLSESILGYDFSVILPAQVKAETFTAFLTQFAPLPVPPVLAAYMVSYAEFILPIMLVVGLGSRVAALGMLIMTAVISTYIMPEALWTTQVYWFAILTLLLTQGPGKVSLDHVIRILNRYVTGRS
jgi:putative oxidoreductase